MESGGAFRHGRTPSSSSDRLLGVSSQSKVGGEISDVEELDEDDVFWIGDSSDPNHRSNSENHVHRKSGILAALPEDDGNRSIRVSPVVCRTISSSSSSISPVSSRFSSPSRMIPAILKANQEKENSVLSKSMPARKFHQSAPMNVPVISKAKAARKARSSVLVEIDDEDDEEMLPPHEIVAKSCNRSPRTTCSVLEGVGRTLKGRDLRQVRNAVWRQTGFLD